MGKSKDLVVVKIVVEDEVSERIDRLIELLEEAKARESRWTWTSTDTSGTSTAKTNVKVYP